MPLCLRAFRISVVVYSGLSNHRGTEYTEKHGVSFNKVEKSYFLVKI